MGSDLIPDDATLVDVWRDLPDGASYVRRIVVNLGKQGRPLTRLRLRLGITGKGIHPNYRVELASFDQDDSRRKVEALDLWPSVPIAVYRGATHQPLADPNQIDLVDGHWSTAVLNITEMREVWAIVKEGA